MSATWLLKSTDRNRSIVIKLHTDRESRVVSAPGHTPHDHTNEELMKITCTCISMYISYLISVHLFA